MSKTNRARLGLAGITVIWGTTFPLTKIILAEIPTFTYTTIRYSIAFLLMLIIFGRSIITSWQALWKSGLIIGIALGLGYLTQTVGLGITSASKAGFFTSLAVILVPVIEALWYKKRPTTKSAISVSLAFVGLILLSGLLGDATSFNIGDALVILCAISFAFHLILFDRLPPSSHRPTIVAQQFLVTALISLVLCFSGEQFPKGAPSPQTWAIVVFMALMATVVAFLVMAWAQRELSAGDVALILLLEPVFAAIFSWMWLGETLGVTGGIGAFLILVSLWLSSQSDSKDPNNLI